MTTIADIDRDLDTTRLAYQQAIDESRWQDADAAYLKLDELLDQRCHCPQAHDTPGL